MKAADTIKVTFVMPGSQQERAIALLSGDGFYAFEEHPDLLEAYITPADFDLLQFPEWISAHFPAITPQPSVEVIPATDWNAEWESTFQPVQVGQFCLIRAPFHPADSGVKIDIQITPKMSFGTGHHATTRLVVSQCEKLDFSR